jgi:hypothetical protein
MNWAVGKIESGDSRTLLEKVLAEINNDIQLISFISDEPNFLIPFEVWEALQYQQDGIGLSLYIDSNIWTTASHGNMENQIEFRCDELAIYFGSFDIRDATEALLKSLQTKECAGEHLLFLGRYSSSGQFNLYFSLELIRELARLKVSIRG